MPHGADTDRGVRTVWSHRRSWRKHQLAPDRYWVEDEVEVLVDGVCAEHLCWSHALSEDERHAYELALRTKWLTLA